MSKPPFDIGLEDMILTDVEIIDTAGVLAWLRDMKTPLLKTLLN